MAFEHGDVAAPVRARLALERQGHSRGDLAQTDGSFALHSDQRSSSTPRRRSRSRARTTLTLESKGDMTITTADGDAERSEATRRADDQGRQSITIEASTTLTHQGRRRSSIEAASMVQVKAHGAARMTRQPHRHRHRLPPARRLRAAASRSSRDDDDVEEAIRADPRHGAGRAPDAARVRLRHPRLRLRVDRRLHARPHRRTRSATRSTAGSRASTCVDIELRHLRRPSSASCIIDITYSLRATNDVRNLVYPFYLIPAEVRSVSIPADQARRPALPGPRQRGAPARSASAARSGPSTTSPTRASR